MPRKCQGNAKEMPRKCQGNAKEMPRKCQKNPAKNPESKPNQNRPKTNQHTSSQTPSVNTLLHKEPPNNHSKNRGQLTQCRNGSDGQKPKRLDNKTISTKREHASHHPPHCIPLRRKHLPEPTSQLADHKKLRHVPEQINPHDVAKRIPGDTRTDPIDKRIDRNKKARKQGPRHAFPRKPHTAPKRQRHNADRNEHHPSSRKRMQLLVCKYQRANGNKQGRKPSRDRIDLPEIPATISTNQRKTISKLQYRRSNDKKPGLVRRHRQHTHADSAH